MILRGHTWASSKVGIALTGRTTVGTKYCLLVGGTLRHIVSVHNLLEAVHTAYQFDGYAGLCALLGPHLGDFLLWLTM
jgi:hypothetical protein